MTIARHSNKDLLESIGRLDSRDFENLTLDLLRATGFRNIVWRTPGMDGGRDIQAEQFFTDSSGIDTRQVWYVECKRYSNSIDWPTLWSKVSYADSHGADYLLLVTNSQPSPHCETEIGRWNEGRRRPSIRVWRGYDLVPRIRLHNDIALAHGLVKFDGSVASLSVEIVEILSKLSQCALSATEFGLSPEIPLAFASALAELFHNRIQDLSDYGRFITRQGVRGTSDLPWLEVCGNPALLEDVGFRAIVSGLRHVLQAKSLRCDVDGERVCIEVSTVLKTSVGDCYNFMRPVLQLALCDDFVMTDDHKISFQLRRA